MKEFQPIAARPAPIKTVGFTAWLRDNLFSSIPNSVVTLSVIALLAYYLPLIFDWAFWSANFTGTTEDACVKEGACWVFINAWSYQFFYGTYPVEEVWRINLTLVLLVMVIAASFTLPKSIRLKASITSWLLLPIVGIAILDGRWLGLEVVSTDLWGGFTLNVFMAAASIIVAFPFSFLWALGRRSEMPFIRSVSVIFIEFFRGVPVLSLFFMGSVMLPLFFAEGTNVDKLIRVWLVLIFFMSGYMAEVFRGGFQAVPSGQYEAADSIGLSYWQKILLIILPQVIKVSMPNILATFVMLFKNTTFLLIIGIPEVVQTLQTALSNSYWLGGHALEGYLFVFLVFWGSCFSMSVLARRIERQMNTDKRD
ncbi:MULTISPECIES: amino acid ABC transporter permease [unclassified Marinobacterium]|jgi:general L-amino acid transport system permease protein|uniref:amino acid ABC transporter permease n=1 Tax=unclassified Marinobacterium TaxID=2644139 RepID=UPI0015687EEE|nr:MULTISPECIES: amino acid ABC transporter permease [unclassified Marinobacterium]NRP15200.1 Inner membrane amino-acid ABC transporter permease protein YhdY [Marinobacterium sp. xm-a-152]NRP28737.1 Inner membrane amino-acid ABC transporter permease protein YhdY [Marinobacterium sp. xm-d-420]NRP35947.1 Inner membrane amino-acid ABC transporter permease protein YhdY [Marinobacterium sp. xm-d-579]NRP39370.1 Inner membrane amino-acid ABC transporter permease protein YhdY [Marinobacterium sp. xm-a-